MSVKEFQINFPGQGINPRIGYLLSSDTLAVISAAGYLNPYMKSQGFFILPTDAILAVGSDGHQWYKPVFGVGGVVTLTVSP